RRHGPLLSSGCLPPVAAHRFRPGHDEHNDENESDCERAEEPDHVWTITSRAANRRTKRITARWPPGDRLESRTASRTRQDRMGWPPNPHRLVEGTGLFAKRPPGADGRAMATAWLEDASAPTALKRSAALPQSL